MLQMWKKGMTAENVRFESVALWIQIWGAPFDMVSPKVATEVGSRLGEVEEVEKRRRQDTQSLFMRVKVAIPISKPIRRGGFLAGSDGQKTWVTFKYERLPLFCHWCGILGHDIKHCAHYFAQTKSSGDVVCQYGEWMRVSGGRTRSPPRRDSSRPNYQRDENVEVSGKVHEDGHGGAAAMASNELRSTAVDKPENVGNGCSGIVPKFQEEIMGEGVKSGIDSERMNARSTEVSLEVQNLNLELAREEGTNHAGNVHEHGEDLKHNGPNLNKSRPTWTRLSRMDCGLNENKKSGTSTSDRKSTRLNSSHQVQSRMPSSA